MPADFDPLPHAPISMVMGLLEHLREAPSGREDLYQLGGPLGYELDDLLPVTEAAKLLGLARVFSGDIELTAQGHALVQAEEPERKRLLRLRLEALPLIGAIRAALDAGDGRTAREPFREALHEIFSPGEAERQLATAVAWARYGEVFDFDPDADEFFLGE
jgi:NitT/TauT family transport system ATP-binding protein